MKKIMMLSGLIILLAIGLLIAQTEDEKITFSKAKLELPETEFDFGYAPEGHFLVHTYILQNLGEDTLKINKVQTTCGCTKAPLEKNALAPGEETKITLIFNSTRYQRKTHKSAIIHTNDPQKKRTRVSFSADMTNPTNALVNISPRFVEFGESKNLEREKIVTITNNCEKGLAITLVDFPPEIIEGLPAGANLGAGDSKEFTFKLLDSVDDEEFFKGSVTIEVNNSEDKKVERFSIPLRGGR